MQWIDWMWGIWVVLLQSRREATYWIAGKHYRVIIRWEELKSRMSRSTGKQLDGGPIKALLPSFILKGRFESDLLGFNAVPSVALAWFARKHQKALRRSVIKRLARFARGLTPKPPSVYELAHFVEVEEIE